MPFFQQEKFQSKGVSLVEILLVIATVGFLILVIANIPPSVNLIGRSRHESLAREIASKALEDKRTTGYINLADGENNIIDSRLNLLPSSLGKTLVENCPASVCTLSENAKNVIASVKWKEEGKDREVKLQTLISEGGL